jgi:hypothetical protein
MLLIRGLPRSLFYYYRMPAICVFARLWGRLATCGRLGAPPGPGLPEAPIAPKGAPQAWRESVTKRKTQASLLRAQIRRIAANREQFRQRNLQTIEIYRPHECE